MKISFCSSKTEKVSLLSTVKYVAYISHTGICNFFISEFNVIFQDDP